MKTFLSLACIDIRQNDTLISTEFCIGMVVSSPLALAASRANDCKPKNQSAQCNQNQKLLNIQADSTFAVNTLSKHQIPYLEQAIANMRDGIEAKKKIKKRSKK